MGIGEAAYQAPSAALIAAYFAPEKRGRAFALVSTAIYFGQILGLAGGPAIAATQGWRTAFSLLGGAGIAIAAPAWIVIREPPREAKINHGTRFADVAASLVRAKSLTNITLGLAL